MSIKTYRSISYDASISCNLIINVSNRACNVCSMLPDVGQHYHGLRAAATTEQVTITHFIL